MFQFSDKGGFGLTCLRARLSTFRFRTLQRFLDRSSHPAYNLFSHFLQQYRNLNLDIHLFLTDINAKFLNSIPNFHCEIITAWLLSNARISVPLTSIYHILNLPLNCTHLNQNTKERLPSPRLLACGITLVGHLINFSTGKWKSAEDLHPPQHRHLLRTSSRALQMDFNIMQSNLANNFPYFFNRQGCWRLPKNLKDIPPFPAPFPEITIPPNINGLTSTSKCLYEFFNRTINSLSEKSMKTPWHENGVTRPTTSAQWKATYHQPISKKEGDVQFRLFHNILPSLPVLHHINPKFHRNCGWCGQRGTCLHLFILCPRIQPALSTLHKLLRRILPQTNWDFDLYWCLVPHAGDRPKEAVYLCNYLIVSLKATIYWLYCSSNFKDVLLIWKYRIQSKIILDFHFYKSQNNQQHFLKKWGHNNSLFILQNDEIYWLI